MNNSAEFVIVGGGVVGASIAYGLLKAGCQVTILDGGPDDPKASVANFGLVWVQGKGPNLPKYQVLTRNASDLWPDFAKELVQDTAQANDTFVPDLAYERNGGLTFCLSDQEFEQRKTYLHKLHNESGGLSLDCEMLDRKAVEDLLPGFKLGPEVVGGSFCWRDGCVNPLNLYTLLLSAINRLDGKVINNAKVKTITREGSVWKISTKNGAIDADHVVLSAGFDNKRLAKQVGLYVPVRPQRGQILVGERQKRTMRLPASTIRQTADGTFLVGATKEDVGMDRSSTSKAAKELASRAIRIYPELKNTKVVRQWGALRIVTPDGAPIYEFADGISAIACHSGITLSPIHAKHLVAQILSRYSEFSLRDFNSKRFSENAQHSTDQAAQ